MLYFNYKLSSYSAFLHDLAEFLHAQPQNNSFELPSEIGEGFFKSISEVGVDAMFYSFTLYKDIILKRTKK